MAEMLYDLPQNCDFNLVENVSNQEFDCSPKLKDKFFSSFSGLLINMPKKVVWPAGVSLSDYPVGPSGDTHGPLRLMVAGLARFSYSMLNASDDISDEVLIVAVNQQSAVTYSGKMPKPDFLDIPPPSADDPDMMLSEEDKNTLLTSHFNFDLVRDIGIPIESANYIVYAILGEHKSNIITVEAYLDKP